jgi:murein DD-endopeptidase MepM/ murein hydrolase activator NlpD
VPSGNVPFVVPVRPGPRSARRLACALAVCVATAVAAAPAGADQGSSSAGGVTFVETPAIAKVACVKGCASQRRLQGGSMARISGDSLAKVTVAIFHGTTGHGDDVKAKVKAASPKRIRVRIPRKATTGPVTVLTSDSVESTPTGPLDILPPLPPGVLASKSHVFPVRGPHDFGGAGARFGTGRAGHSHQGHDIFARCGTPLVAARGGKVQFEEHHPAGGHYLVIDGAGTRTDYAYMHLVEASPFDVGDKVSTGQRIGSVGDSGNARGCHLHFELWSGPGWYQGGRPIDPLRALKAWDSWS